MDAKMLFLMNGFTENKVMHVTDDAGVFISQRRSVVAAISKLAASCQCFGVWQCWCFHYFPVSSRSKLKWAQNFRFWNISEWGIVKSLRKICGQLFA